MFWRNADNAVALSLIGCNLYEKMTLTLPPYDTEGQLALANQKAYLEQTAKTMVELIYAKSQWRALYLLMRPLKIWGHHSCMPLAMQANCREFISSIACQHAIQVEWRAGVHANVISLLLAYICPLLIFTPLVTFSSNSSSSSDSSSNNTVTKNAAERDIVQRLKRETKHVDMQTDTNAPSISVTKKVAMFYQAPRTKFCIHAVFYVIFLAFFSYTLLFGLKPDSVTVPEAALMLYLGSFFVETTWSFLKSVRGSGSVRARFGSWLSKDKWHAYDVILMVASAVPICLRLGWNSTYIVAKTIYSIILVLYFARLFQFYSVNRKLGPNSVMIFRMLVELAIFLFILLIFLLPYGVSTQALLFPYMTQFNPEVLKNVFYYPYYRMYGELFLEESEAQMEGCNATTADGITCPLYNFMTPLFLAIYMLVVAVLLINLLIAIFSNVYTEVEAQSTQFWKTTLYYLLVEYKAKPVVPAPFSVLQTLLEVMLFPPCAFIRLCRRLTSRKRSHALADKAHGDRASSEHAAEEASGTAASVEDEEKSSHLEVVTRDEETEELDNSITQMERWTLRQILKQEEACGDANQIYSMMEEVGNALAVADHPDEPTPPSAPEPRRSLGVQDLNVRLSAMEEKIENSLKHHESVIKQLLEQLTTGK
ncbi:Transient receptor potential cation channel subfamily M member 1 [Taenia crassiceps]|uniref:Transient receptor potential cation channel subfamily M member 1 n=1 Tax=Taenia crassiceps TaxID=6207 RepID=A0ABR4Q5P6_9CEST